MTYKLFVDDERFPPDDGHSWVIARTMNEVQYRIFNYGMPCYISWDHDLGENEPNGLQIVKWLIEYDMDNNVIPEGFTFYTHSQNPIGATNINSLLNSYLKNKFNV